MTQKKSPVLPQSTRFIVNVEREMLKEIKKFAIDFEIDEREVPALAIRYLVNAYVAMNHQDRANGLDYFFPAAAAGGEQDSDNVAHDPAGAE